MDEPENIIVKPITAQLSKEILGTLSVKDIIYAEYASPGAMGNSGGVMLYVINDNVLTCYETNIRMDKDLYNAAVDLLSTHQITSREKTINENGILNFYGGGYGNNVFINKKVTLKKGYYFFVYSKKNIDYIIFPSVHGVFSRVAVAIRKHYRPKKTKNSEKTEKKYNHIVEFYKGKVKDSKKRYISNILDFNYFQLEEIHDYIQWLFPLKEPSLFNRNAPILTDEDILEFKNNDIIKSNIIKALKLLLNFYGYHLDEDNFMLVKKTKYSIRLKYWMTPGNHNFLRITRILKFLKLMDMENYALLFFNELQSLYDNEYKNIIGENTYNYWYNAVKGE